MVIDIYGMDYCTYCAAAKLLCEAEGLDYVYSDVGESLDELKERIGSFKTVPQIFVDDKHIGGFAEFKKYVEKELYEG